MIHAPALALAHQLLKHLPLRYLAVASLLLLSGCVTSVISPQQESEMGAKMSLEVEGKIGLYSDPTLEAYVSQVGQRLASELGPVPYTFHFAIVDQHEPNAFASPGGYIYISRGLLVQMNSEAELAGVLAHEISHITQRHHTRQVGRNIGAGLLTLPGRAVGIISEDLGNIINTPIEALGSVYLSSYSRGQETEADEYGMALAAKSGYEPTALVDALQGLERSAQYLSGEQHQASFFDSHPTTPTRVADIRQKAVAIPRTPLAPIASKLELIQHMDGLWWGPQNPQQGIFQDQIYLNADFDFRLAFAEEWETVNSPRFVAARAPDGAAYIALSGTNSSHSVIELGDALAKKMRDGAALEPTERRSIKVGDWPGEQLRYDDNSGGESVSLYYLFVNSGRTTFTLISMGLERYRDDVQNTVSSLRQLNAAERNSIGGLRVRVANIRSGETLSSFGPRVGNQWSPELTGIINAVESESPFASGTTLKLVRQERYVPEGAE